MVTLYWGEINQFPQPTSIQLENLTREGEKDLVSNTPDHSSLILAHPTVMKV